MDRMFRLLKADEIDCRVSTVSEKGCSLLLYKDARVDQNILDETVGPERWQRAHEVIDGNLYCNVGIWFERSGGYGEWVWKQDVGTESYTEKEKGQASDSFKRACFNWGIGRELYTAPFIWIPAGKCKIVDGNNGKKTTYDRFYVKAIGYDDAGNINKLTIANEKTNVIVFAMGDAETEEEKMADRSNDKISETHVKALLAKYPTSKQINNILEHFGIKKLEDMTYAQLAELNNSKGEKK